jgi:hypothetical protein
MEGVDAGHLCAVHMEPAEAGGAGDGGGAAHVAGAGAAGVEPAAIPRRGRHLHSEPCPALVPGAVCSLSPVLVALVTSH